MCGMRHMWGATKVGRHCFGFWQENEYQEI
jgi:hypothetical protein